MPYVQVSILCTSQTTNIYLLIPGAYIERRGSVCGVISIDGIKEAELLFTHMVIRFELASGREDGDRKNLQES